MLDSSPEDEDFPGRLLHQAALWDNRELLEDLLEGGQLSFINSQDSWGRTPLHAAAITENSSCLKLLLNAGADPNIQCGPRGENKTPLHLSAEHGHMKNVQLLLQNNANMFIKDLGGLTAKDLAKNAGHTECANEIKSAADAKERARLDIHTALRDACNRADLAAVEQLLGSLSGDTELIVNMAPSGANTLLFLVCQMGNKEIVKILLDSGADGRYHPVTKYSPLYIACYHGHYEIVEMLLLKFPELIKQHTVEHWLPCHACCINGHAKVLELLFDFPYPSKVLDKFRDSSGDWQYHMAFNINDRDVTGQTILYLSSLLGNKKLLDVILKFKVRAVRVESENEISGATETDVKVSPTKRRISNGIQNILTKLNLSRENTQENLNELDPNTSVISPLLIDMYCNNNTETALHAAVKGKYYDIAAALLNAGSNPNAVIKAYMDLNETLSCLSIEEESNYGQSTALVEACRNRHAEMVDLLLSYGARDDDCKALAVVVNNHDDALTAKLLAMKAHPDPEYKINKKSMTDVNSSHFSIFANIPGLTYSALFPNTPTMINWHNQRCHLSQIRTQWIVDASLNLNPKLKQNPKGGDVALYAITRLDISNNSLTSVPLIIFQLSSLRTLNVSQNKIDKLPLPVSKINHRKKLHSAENLDYDCPVLEELYLQENKLDNIPEAIFRLPALTTLVIAKNKLQNLPYNIWTAPKLKELNVSFNLLRELPSADAPDVSCRDEFERLSVSSSDSQLSSYADMLLDTEQTDPEVELEEFRQTTVRYRKKDRSLSQVPLTKRHLWIKNVEVTEQILRSEELVSEKSSQLSYLNLSHNLFNSIPVVLPCLAVNLTRLDMAFNTLRSMSHITSYPGSLKQLDLSHNRITCWPSLPQVEAQDVMELGHLVCYCKLGKEKPVSGIRRHSERSVRNIVLHSVCSHRRHLRLDNLRTLILANNELSRVQLTTDDDGDNASEDDETERNQNHNKVRLMFPNLSMLDVSNNKLKEIPQNIYELCSLSVLNISGNLGINDLPPQMGLLSRLWNLNTAGCPLQEPLKAMIESKKYKTMDIIGYLKSVLEDARPYTRMKLMIVGVQGIGKTSLLEQLRAEGITRRKSEHWAKRMGNKNINAKTSRGTNMSTVGVDIGDWIYEKKIRNQSSHGPVIFRTWDFGGQKEYYATHQYFLSKRSLYLVVWKITDGHRGLNEIFQWLINIQARAPNSPVIIVGTHFDLIQDRDSRLSEDLQQLIRERFINVIDAEKCGLPRVLDTIEISCRTRHNVKLLCNLIYDTVFSLRPPGSKELLLEQKVPASYLMLEDVVGALAAERRANGLDPVMRTDQYKSLVTAEMQRRYGKNFRDWSELHQATLFLHDNGVLLHYEDATLKDLYFLDPQWLCDMLAHVVTIREINPFAQTGIMKLDDLNHIFKASNIGCLDARSYIVNLLNKFEVALTWDSRTLLIPSLLPSEEDVQRAQMYGLASLVKVKVPLRTRCREGRNRNIAISPKSVLYKDCDGKFQMSLPSSGNQTITSQEIHYQVDGVPSKKSITRLLLMSYFPSGFWSRLISRLLADDTIVDIIRSFFLLPKQVTQDQQLVKLLDCKVEWVLWQTGLQLMYGNFVLFRMRELQQNVSSVFHHNRLRLKQDGIWCDLDTHSMSILEIHFPVESLRIKPVSSTVDTESSSKMKEPVTIDPTLESTSKLLALAVDHIDILLEDWYPTLGTRFVHTSEGKFLVTRIVPCPKCLEICEVVEDEQGANRKVTATKTMEAPDLKNIRPRMSQDSYTSEGDSGVEQDSASSSRVSSAEGHPGMKLEDSTNVILYSWTVEECILAAYGAKCVSCPTHYDVPLSRIAPDTVFLDLGDRNLIKPEHIKRGRLLGRGAFGFVFCGTYRNRGTNAVIEVAMKMLQPVQPGPKARPSANMAYKAAQTKWDRDPVQYACKAYCTARQELNILLSLKHPNIVPFVGVCTNPLALVLDLAPLGALDQVLRDYKRSGVKVGPFVMQNVVLQVAKAIEYLHRQRIIYRDLKSENVLVWEMPSSYSDDLLHPVHVKLADYGISRSTLPSGTKGFGGTEGFMAPEIMRYNGEEEYTEKVDCFSFGMFLYELLTLHQPFEGYESVKECILEGGRPPLTYRETLYPSYCLDLMVLCWSQQPKDRPSASQIVSIASAPEFTHLNDVVRINHQGLIVATANVLVTNITDEGLLGSELWMISNNSRIDLLLATDRGWMQHHTLNVPIEPTCACTVMNTIWLGDKSGIIHAYSASFGHKLFSYTLEKNENAVEALLFVPKLKRVACSLANGRLFLLHSEVIPSTPIAAEGSFVMAELCSKSIAHCLCAPVSESNGKCELWSGESNGQLTIYTLRDQMVVDQESTVHFDCTETEGDVVKMLSNGHTLCTYIHPGCIIYQWDRKKRCIINKLDCSKLVPCSESLKSISIEEHLSPTHCQVTSLAVLHDDLYIGTTWGCIIIAEKSTLRPITVFRPYEEDVAAIVPMVDATKGTPLIATVGYGYRNLLARYTDIPILGEEATENGKRNIYALLWRAEHWNAN